jgi:hypothetical protein
MHSSTRYATCGAALLLLLGASASFAPGARTARASDEAPAKCCFTNPGYAGTCEVVPGPDETCASILAYLNNPMSQGKGYCGNTTIRGGWAEASCDAKK